jgi:hypothetical protein
LRQSGLNGDRVAARRGDYVWDALSMGDEQSAADEQLSAVYPVGDPVNLGAPDTTIPPVYVRLSPRGRSESGKSDRRHWASLGWARGENEPPRLALAVVPEFCTAPLY